MHFESGANLIHLPPRFIMGLSDEKLQMNYDNLMTVVACIVEFLTEA